MATPSGRFLIEIHCLNRKALDISLSIPRDWLRFDPAIRKRVAESILRGQVTVQVLRDPSDLASLIGLPPIELLQELKTEWEKTAIQLHLDVAEIDLSFLRQECRDLPRSSLKPLDEEGLEELLQSGLEAALNECIDMREKEGAFLSADISYRMKNIAKATEEIEKLSTDAPERFRERLMKRLKESGVTLIADDEKVLREVIVFAEKLDVSEEITRMRSHLGQFFDLLDAREKSVGRPLDFLIQEMNREINTIASKSVEVEISRLVVAAKSELEKIREQVQNIE